MGADVANKSRDIHAEPIQKVKKGLPDGCGLAIERAQDSLSIRIVQTAQEFTRAHGRDPVGLIRTLTARIARDRAQFASMSMNGPMETEPMDRYEAQSDHGTPD